MDGQEQGTRDEVLALKQFLQGMLLADQDGEAEFSLPSPRKGVIRNDKLLELMGVTLSEASSSDGCSAYSLDDERSAAVAPLQILSPELRQQKAPCLRDHDRQAAEAIANYDCVDTEELLSEEQDAAEDNRRRESYFSRSHMNNRSVKLLRRSATFEPDFQTRMKKFLLKNQQKKERIRQSLVVEDEPGVTPMPRINRRSKCIPRNVSHLMVWHHDKKSRLACMRDAETAKQEATCVGKPSISKRSLSICSKRQDDVAHCKVEDRLHLLGLIYQYQLEERQRADERQASLNVQPHLAPHSANAQRRMRFSVHDRLYQLSKRSKNNNDHEYCAKNAKKTATRRRRDRKAARERFEDTAKRLHAMDRQYKEKQLLQSEEMNKYFDSLRAAPKMSARSRKLAAKKKKIPAPKSPLLCDCCGGKEDKEGKCGCTVEPRVNQKHAADVYERQLRWKTANEARRSQQKQLQDTLAMAECTFRNPFYQKALNAPDDRADRVNAERGNNNNDPGSAFFKRCMIWAEKRDLQVAREKKISQQRQLAECTFKPRVMARTPKYLADRRRQSNQQDEESTPSSRSSSPTQFLDCSTPEQQQDEMLAHLYSALDLQALAGELSPQLNADDEGG